ncbi:hypothetical protein M8C13_38585 [Crossiella sp. SN42]|uniref:prenyltransferase/squalene oxidase repeat-containing protein n=1 Tax=Crossiella sp. SN42 TaxID=2944808 RepID=UPI00207D5BDC|nr:prenyltransferase/squalene oxidase repeat-containing protein [Crossiella sp. SN42]MCO1581673.1 hypothetical protein [Crossiella sp. SN42]
MSDPRTAVLDLIEDSLDDPLSDVRGGFYDTGQVLRACAGTPGRIAETVANAALGHLLSRQNEDHSWGSPVWPVEYRLVPTLGAVTGLAGVVASRGAGTADDVHVALRHGLGFLAAHADHVSVATMPDTVAVELIVPAMLADLDRGAVGDVRFRTVLTELLRSHRDQLERLHALRSAVRAGQPVSGYLLHCAEVLPAAVNEPPPGTGGSVGCSPAATAVAFARSGGRQIAAGEFLVQVAQRWGGAHPTMLPIAPFEQLWVAAAAVRLDIPVPNGLRQRLSTHVADLIGADGVPLAPGLPADGDLTATAVYVLCRLGQARDPACLLAFESGNGFVTHQRERTASVTTNAHMLEAFGEWARQRLAGAPAYQRQQAILSRYLVDCQHADGSWTDKWHASPIYALSCALPALCRYAPATAGPAIGRAVAWLLGTQRRDGSWGRWTATLEETALAVHSLHIGGPMAGAEAGHHAEHATKRGLAFLATHAEAPAEHPVRTPLWHGKELFQPERISRAITLSALTLRVGGDLAQRPGAGG